MAWVISPRNCLMIIIPTPALTVRPSVKAAEALDRSCTILPHVLLLINSSNTVKLLLFELGAGALCNFWQRVFLWVTSLRTVFLVAWKISLFVLVSPSSPSSALAPPPLFLFSPPSPLIHRAFSPAWFAFPVGLRPQLIRDRVLRHLRYPPYTLFSLPYFNP